MDIFSTETREKFIVLRDSGCSLEEISQIMKIDKEKLAHWDAALTQEPAIKICEELEKQRIKENI